jgi:hypothetical protein
MSDATAFSTKQSTVVPYPRTNNSIRVPGSGYRHHNQVANELQALIRLETGWDGYRAKPVSLHNVHYALNILEKICSDESPDPQIFPGTNGDLQLEWHINDIDIELHIVRPNDVYFWTNDPQICPDGDEIHIIGSDFTRVSGKIKELTEIRDVKVASAR